MALVLENVLIRITGDQKLAAAYMGHEKSPFSDIPPTSPMYNTIMNVTTRGIMDGSPLGEFRTDEAINGADAILVIRELKAKMNIL